MREIINKREWCARRFFFHIKILQIFSNFCTALIKSETRDENRTFEWWPDQTTKKFAAKCEQKNAWWSWLMILAHALWSSFTLHPLLVGKKNGGFWWLSPHVDINYNVVVLFTFSAFDLVFCNMRGWRWGKLSIMT